MSEILLEVRGIPVFLDSQEHLVWEGEFTVDADGHPRCYGPKGTKPLDYLGNAGSPGRWWGVATDNGRMDGEPIVQSRKDPAPDYYVSMTAYVNDGFYYSDPRRYLHSGEVMFMVIPGNVRKAVQGVCKGCRGKVTDKQTGVSLYCVVGDIGPTNHLGEGSMALAQAFGLDPDPKKGGSSDAGRFVYECWPGVAMEGFELQS